MNLRARHLACLVLLLSTLGAAQASADSSSGGFYAHPIGALLYRYAMDRHAEAIADARSAIAEDEENMLALPDSGRAALWSPWTMRSPAAHAAALVAFSTIAR